MKPSNTPDQFLRRKRMLEEQKRYVMSLWKMTEIIHYTCCDSKVMLMQFLRRKRMLEEQKRYVMSLWKMTEIIHYTCCDSKVMLFFNRLSFHASSHHFQVILTSCNQLMWENVIGNVVYCTIFSTVCDFVLSILRHRRDYVNYARKLVEGSLEIEDVEIEVNIL